jgi:hypothetical protein
MKGTQDRLYNLLPAIYRLRDAEQGYNLRAFLRVIEEQADVVEDDISRLYDNLFIETCEDWVVPYIGDLFGYLPLRNTGEPASMRSVRDQDRARVLIPRRDVANTIRYRRRKGTLSLLELLSDDVADWPARAVEFYRLLGWTQHLNHQYLLRGRTTDIRNGNVLDCIDGPFDTIAHTADIRKITANHTRRRYNIPEVGLFVCRLKPYSVTKTPAFCIDNASPNNYTFSVLGNDTPLFNRWVPDPDTRHIAGEVDLPVQIRRRGFEEHIWAHGHRSPSRASGVYWGEDKSIAIWAPEWPVKTAIPAKDGLPIPAARVIPADLSSWNYPVPKDHVAVDPALGRIRFPAKQPPKKGVTVSYSYGFSADIGGGEYRRPIPGPDLVAISQLRTEDIVKVERFAERLDAADDQNDPVSAFINKQLSVETRILLKTPAAEEFCPLLVKDLNAVIATEAFYDPVDPGRFKSIEPLPAELADLCSHEPDPIRVLRRNRLLLEEVYPEFIRSNYPIFRVGEKEVYKTITTALAAWQFQKPAHAVIELADSSVWVEQIAIHLEKGQSLNFRAADAKRPVLRQLNWQTSLPDAVSVTGGPGSRITFDGLLVTGRGISVTGPDAGEENRTPGEDLCEVVIRHCTLVPGWSLDSECCPDHANEPSIELLNTRSKVLIEKSIIGPIRVVADNIRAEPNRIRIHDSIVDATGSDLDVVTAQDGFIAHAILTFRRCTVIGKVSAHAIRLAEDSIFSGIVTVARSQVGCMRFCYVPFGSRTPRRFNCQPDKLTGKEGTSEDEKKRIRREIRPYFTSPRYGTPGYCQLATGCPVEIRCGAEDESEMGVFHDLYQPQREDNLRLRLDEYTPSGMETGIIFVN